MRTIGGFWALLAGVARPRQAEELLVDRTGDIREHSFPNCRPKVDQHEGLRAIFLSTCNPAWIDKFESFDLADLNLECPKVEDRNGEEDD